MFAARDNGTPDLLAELEQAYTGALVRGDEGAAEHVVREAIEAELDEGDIDDNVIAPAMRAIGDLWAEGQLSIAEEHLATEISLRVLALEREAFRVARSRSRAVVLLSAVEQEQHVVGLRMAASLLAHAGYETRLLGPNLPATSLGPVVSRHEPAVVALTATMPANVAALDDAIDVVARVRPHAGIVIGGPAASRAGHSRPTLRACRRVGDVVAIVDGLAQRAPFN